MKLEAPHHTSRAGTLAKPDIDTIPTPRRLQQMNAGVVALIIGLCASLSTVVLVQGGSFSSNVVMLNSRNWRKEVEDSGHAIFINVW